MQNLHPLLNPAQHYEPEEEAQALARYCGYGRELFQRLYVVFPELRGRFRFFRASGSDDVWSICEPEGDAFGVQLDPDCEVICLWRAGAHEEIGTWMPDPVAHAIDRIREDYAQGTAPRSG